MKLCISCGAPLRKPSDYPLGHEGLDYCKFCARPDGSMLSWEEKLEGLAEAFVRTKKVDRETARRMAGRLLATQPAWEGIHGKESE